MKKYFIKAIVFDAKVFEASVNRYKEKNTIMELSYEELDFELIIKKFNEILKVEDCEYMVCEITDIRSL